MGSHARAHKTWSQEAEQMTAQNMKRVTKGMAVLGIAALSVTLGVAGCGAKRLSSKWRDRTVTIDAVNNEWQGTITDFEEEQVSVGLLNDDQYLYIGLVFMDPQVQAQALTKGLTFWFDASGKRKKTFGIHYPLEMPEEDRAWFIRALMDGENPDSLTRVFSALPATMELLTQETGPKLSVPINGSDIKVAAKAYRGWLVYELMVPLAASATVPHAIGARPGQAIAVGIEAPAMSRPTGRPAGGRGPGGMGGEPPRGGGGPPGGGGFPGGGRGPGGPGGGPDRREPLNLWTTIELSAPTQAK